MESKNLFFDKKNQNLQNKKNAYFGVVVDNNDPNDSGMLYVRIPELDKNMDSKNLIKAYPLLSKVNNYTIPTIGEAVIIFLIDPDKPYTNRFWVGPIISQFQKMEQDPYQTALNLTDQPNNTPLKPISTIPTAKGLFPSKYERDVVYSLGRNNTDIKHEKNKITIRAGKHLTVSPVLGFRASRAARFLAEKIPNPASDTSSPFFKVEIIESMINCTTSSDCVFVPPILAWINSASAALFIEYDEQE
jgi:hypothetical protein